MTTYQFIERKLHVAAEKKTVTTTLDIFLIRMCSIKQVINTHLATIQELNLQIAMVHCYKVLVSSLT